MERWVASVKPNETGYLGTTAGVAPDGSFIAIVRFESQSAARANDSSVDQRTWWETEMMSILGTPTVIDCPDVALFYGGGSDDAGFVQVMRGHTADPVRFKQISRRFE